MRKIESYNSYAEALKLLDNGGRFYNILTKEDDGIISKAELSKVAGLFYDKQKMILYFQLSISLLENSDQELLISKLSPDLRKLYDKYLPKELSKDNIKDIGKTSKNAIFEGTPKRVDPLSNFHGYITIPVTTGKITSLSMIPIIEVYDVYEVYDDTKKHRLTIAHWQGHESLPEKNIRVAGLIKELREDKREETPSLKYLEAAYYIDS